MCYHNSRAEQAIRWYYRKPDIRSEMEAVEHFVKSTQATSIRERLQQIKEPQNRRSLIMIILLFMFMQLSGLNTIAFYMEIIIRKGMVTSIEPSTVVIIISTISMFDFDSDNINYYLFILYYRILIELS